MKKEKTRLEGERLKLINARLAGDAYDKGDCEAITASWAAAMALGLTELQATLPPQLEGLDAAAIQDLLKESFYKFRENLSNLNSELWHSVYRNQPTTPDEKKS